MKTILFGGTFDPIHLAHVQLAETARQQLGADEVWFLVSPQNPWKANIMLSADEDRLEMVRLATKENSRLVASDYEFGLDKPSYTYQTLRHLRKDYPDVRFTILIGGDNWMEFDHWAEYKEILTYHPVAVYPRPGCAIETPPSIAMLSHTLTIIDAPLMDISSTEVRNRVRNGIATDGMIDDDVARYIKEHRLYE